jgi:NAD(P)H-dependent flavin oxidoreductase YrpB (nitropropane dioxygenase family)
MGPDITGPDLVAAVSNAGGLGLALHSQNTTTPMTNRSTTTNPSPRFSGTQPTKSARHSHHGRDNPLGRPRSQYVTVTLLADESGPNHAVRQHVPCIVWINLYYP